MARVAALLFLAMLAVGTLADDAVPPKVENVDHSRHHHDWDHHEHHEHHEKKELTTTTLNFYEPDNAFITSFGGETNPAGTPAGYSGYLTCGKKGDAAMAVCHQAGIFTGQAAENDIEPFQQAVQMLACEIKANSCGIPVGQIHGIGLTFNGNWAQVPGQGAGGAGPGSIYPVYFSVIGGTKAYANVIGGTVTFTGNSDGIVTTMALRRAA